MSFMFIELKKKRKVAQKFFVLGPGYTKRFIGYRVEHPISIKIIKKKDVNVYNYGQWIGVVNELSVN